MERFSKKQTKSLLSKLYWDMEIDPEELYRLFTKKITKIGAIDRSNLFSRILMTYNWYTILKMIPPQELYKLLDDDILNRIHPKDLREKYLYARNVLSNKICALSRLESKDIVDVIFIAKSYPFDWVDIISEAKEKDLWVEPIAISKIVKEINPYLLENIKWIEQPDFN